MRLDEFLEKGYKLEAGDEVMYDLSSNGILILPSTVESYNEKSLDDISYDVIKSAQLEREEQLQVEIDKSFEKLDKGNCTFYTHEEMLEKLKQRKEKLPEWDNLIQVNHILPDGTFGEAEFYIGRICGRMATDSSVEINNGSMTVWSGNSNNFVVKVVDAKLQIQ